MKEARPKNVCGWLAALAAAALPVVCFAQVQTTEPATGPVRAPAPLAPPTPHAAIRPADKILVLPFAPLNPADAQAWIGKSVQQSLVADLLAAAPRRVASAEEPAANSEQAIAAAKKAGAGYVVTGTFLTTKDLVRVTGQIIDVTNGQPVSGLMVTGVPDQLFRMEDGLAMQVKAALLPDVFAQEQAAQQQIAQQQPTPPTTTDQSPRMDVGALSPVNNYYSIYAYPVAANDYMADTERYYYSYPSTIYGYDTFGYGYGVPLYGFGYFSYPYCYASPFLRCGGVGVHRICSWGHDWQNGHAWHSGWQHVDHHVAGAFNFQPDPGIFNSTQINYAGIVNGNLTNIGANRAIVPNFSSNPQRALSLTNAATVATPIGDPPGSVRAHSMLLITGSGGVVGSGRMPITYHSFAGADEGVSREINSRGQIVIHGHNVQPGSGPLILQAGDAGQPAGVAGRQITRSLPAQGGVTIFAAPTGPAPAGATTFGAPTGPAPGGVVTFGAPSGSSGSGGVNASAPPPPPPSAPPPSAVGPSFSVGSARGGYSGSAARGNSGSAAGARRGGR